MKALILCLALAGCATPRSYYIPGPNVSHEDVVVGTDGTDFIVAAWDFKGEKWTHRKIKGNRP